MVYAETFGRPCRRKMDDNWDQLEPEQRHELRLSQQLTGASKPEIKVESTEDVLSTLESISLSAFKDRVAAMPSRFDQIILDAARLMEPEIQSVKLPHQTLKTQADVETWVAKSRDLLIEKLKNGTVMV